MSSEVADLIALAKQHNSTNLLVSQTNQDTYFVTLRVLMGKKVHTCAAQMSHAMLEMVIEAFDPDHSIRRRSESLRQEHGLRELGTVLALHK